MVMLNVMKQEQEREALEFEQITLDCIILDIGLPDTLRL
jgi:hypothetical protein